MKIKLCHIISGDLWAGAEVMAYNLISEQAKNKKLEVSVIILNQGQLVDNIEKTDNVKLFVLDEQKLSFINILIRTIKQVRNLKPNILHSHRYKENILSFISSLFIKNGKLVTTQHGLVEIIDKKAGILKKIKKMFNMVNLYLLSNKFNVVAVSSDIKERLNKFYEIKLNRISVIHNGVKIQNNKKTNKQIDKFRIGSAGRLVGVKDFSFLIATAPEVKKRKINIEFYIAGDGPELNKLNFLIKKHNLEKTIFLEGHLNDISKFYEKLNVYINTSIHEGIPMTILEAMNYGLPVIAPKVGGIVEIIDNNVQGFLIEDRKPEKFAEKCIELYSSRELYEKLSVEAKIKVANNFSVQVMEQNYFQLYKESIIL